MCRKVKYYAEIQELTLFEDAFMNLCFENEIKLVEFILRVILKRDDINLVSIETQKVIRGFKRSVKFDIFAIDDNGRCYDIEIQRKNSGAGIRRIRFYFSMSDYESAELGVDFEKLADNYVIFITERDSRKRGLPIEHLETYSRESGERINNGMNMIYVNGSDCNPDTALGRLMHDFSEPDPDKMYYTILADRVRFLKNNPVEVKKLSGVMERLMKQGIEKGVEKGRKEGIAEGVNGVISNMLKLGQFAFDTIAQNTGVSVRRVRAIAKSLGISEAR